MAQNVTRMIDNKIACLNKSSMAEHFTVEGCCRACDEATRISAGHGYFMEYPVQRYYRNNRFLLSGGGTH
jgi:alkylation response protein AidB-like acyl-CoA dehydrogenase